jgi:hypothetical protein
VDSLAIPALFLAACGVWAFFHFTSGNQRAKTVTAVLWVCLALGAAGFAWEVAARGGRLPFIFSGSVERAG